jgi:hypothetical protein
MLEEMHDKFSSNEQAGNHGYFRKKEHDFSKLDILFVNCKCVFSHNKKV